MIDQITIQAICTAFPDKIPSEAKNLFLLSRYYKEALYDFVLLGQDVPIVREKCNFLHNELLLEMERLINKRDAGHGDEH